MFHTEGVCLCVSAAGPGLRAAADPPVEELPSLHGSSRVTSQYGCAPSSDPGSVLSGHLLLPHYSPGATSKAPIHYRSLGNCFSQISRRFLYVNLWERAVFVLPRSGVRRFDAETPVCLRQRHYSPRTRRPNSEHLVQTAGNRPQVSVWGKDGPETAILWLREITTVLLNCSCFVI